MFLLILSYKKPLAEVDRFVAEHRAFLERYYESGQFLLSGRKEPRTGGVIFANVESETELAEIIRQDPFCREQIADYEIIEFIPSMSAEHLSHLKET
ncbi:GTP cyclohydrolase [Chitinimonas arctica]|uniref:GTP cyclohydrolase n=1 Tax=Chitinimonas arctica TaxID=2594795 RepID=A0A516SIC4_9NEIS|nr:YciI family protein [Chitinimonas arctica]QDQ27907.1 GTP cyclohydrolase [Chitinimonas arctica]